MYIINYNDLNLPYDSNNSSNNDYYISVQDITYSENSIPSKLSTSYSFTISESNVNEEDVTQLDTVEYDGEYISWNASVGLNYNVIIYDESGDTPIAF